MNVIGHQHVGVHDAAIALSVMLDAFEVDDSVALVAKNIASVIAPNDDMIYRSDVRRRLTVIRFEFCALDYLNNWQRYDRDFCQRLQSADFEERRKAVVDAAKYYRITRNFKLRFDSESRLTGIIKVLDSITASSVNRDYVSQVEKFTSEINAIYGQRNLSAASKLLWLKCKCPVIILDSRALKALKKEFKTIIEPVSYPNYCDTWLFAFRKKREEIVSAATKLQSVLEFSFDSNANKADIASLVKNEWFLHRVFDNYLWHKGG